MGEFAKHLCDAIRINSSRAIYYARRAGWRSAVLSVWLILSEILCLPLAWYFDRKARPFNARGIDVVKRDFVPMDVPPADRPVPDIMPLPKTTRREALNALKAYQQTLYTQLRQVDFAVAAQHTAAMLERIQLLASEQGTSLAMTRHLLESIGLCCANATQWIRRDPEVASLCQQLAWIQVALVTVGPWMDALGSQCQARGAGILINDVPAIPFPPPQAT